MGGGKEGGDESSLLLYSKKCHLLRGCDVGAGVRCEGREADDSDQTGI
jgi:hypothetical protein